MAAATAAAAALIPPTPPPQVRTWGGGVKRGGRSRAGRARVVAQQSCEAVIDRARRVAPLEGPSSSPDAPPGGGLDAVGEAVEVRHQVEGGRDGCELAEERQHVSRARAGVQLYDAHFRGGPVVREGAEALVLRADAPKPRGGAGAQPGGAARVGAAGGGDGLADVVHENDGRVLIGRGWGDDEGYVGDGDLENRAKERFGERGQRGRSDGGAAREWLPPRAEVVVA